MRSRRTLWLGATYSQRTLSQSASSSSATSWARPVSVPWPISTRAMRIRTVSSGLTTTQALSSLTPSAAPAASSALAGTRKPSAKAPAAAAEPVRNTRRESVKCFVIPTSLEQFGCALDTSANSVVGAAAAAVRHFSVDVFVRWVRVVIQQSHCSHDLAGLAIATLRNVEFQPRLLHRVRTVRRNPLSRGDPLVFGDVGDGRHAGARGNAIDMHGAGAAGGDTAAELRAGQADLLADRPE